MREPVTQRQFLEAQDIVLKIDGSEVTTTASKAGLTVGKHVATVKKGTGADSNLVTITLTSPLGMAPTVFFQPVTLDCLCREEVAPTKSVIQVRTLELDGVTQEDDADFNVLIKGTEGIREGKY